MCTPMIRRSTATLASAGTLLLGVLGAASTTQAATIHACYKRGSGQLRILRAKQRCRKGESRVYWNTIGPPGKNGATGKNGTTGKTGATGTAGKNGTNGTNGAVAGYSAKQAGGLDITGAPGSILSKELPAGHYLVSAKVEISATAKEAGGVQAECELTLATGTGESVLDSSGWTASLWSVSSEFLATTALPLESVVNLTAPGTVAVECETVRGGAKEEKVTASGGQLVAVQTTNNS
jgi:hypothetical protein